MSNKKLSGKKCCWKFIIEDDFHLFNMLTCHSSVIGVQNLKISSIHKTIKKFVAQPYTKWKVTRPSTLSFSYTPGPSTSIEGWSPLCRHFKYSEILLATENFNSRTIIGRGGFGNVYKGDVTSGSTRMGVAIKVLLSESQQGPEEFRAELEVLPTLRHCNIVPLIGYCNYRKEMILVYEYIPNGTLRKHLHKLGNPLSWIQRLKICIGVARGLHYLHNCTGIDVGVIHLDIKSSNILLNESWVPKIIDFGLATIGPTNDQPLTYVDSEPKGTLGYMDPAFIESYCFTVKSDVYAFGMVLLEVLCGKPVYGVFDRSLELQTLAAWFQDCIKSGILEDIPDFQISHQISPKCLKQYARIAQRCLHHDPEQRPNMAEVLFRLESLLIKQRKYNDSLQQAEQQYLDNRDKLMGLNHKVKRPKAIKVKRLKIKSVHLSGIKNYKFKKIKD